MLLMQWKDYMLKFEYNTYDCDMEDIPNNSVILEWEDEEENIYDIIEKFKYFLLAKSYSPELVNRLQYLSNEQLAKLKLLGEDCE